MTDAEFWAVMAITCEKAGVLPDHYPHDDGCNGLCALLLRAREADLIDQDQYFRLASQMQLAKPCVSGGYWWSVGEVAPRVRAMKKLAKLAMEEQ